MLHGVGLLYAAAFECIPRAMGMWRISRLRIPALHYAAATAVSAHALAPSTDVYSRAGLDGGCFGLSKCSFIR